MKQHAPGGFTLIEVLVVIAIIAIIAAAVAPTAFRAPERARIASTLADYQAVKTAALSYFADTAAWPADAAASVGFVSAPAPAVPGWDGPYLDQWPARAKWGNGVNNYKNDALQDWDGAVGGDAARYFEITLIPDASAATLDTRIDAAASETAGVVRHDASGAGATATVRILIQTDVTVN